MMVGARLGYKVISKPAQTCIFSSNRFERNTICYIDYNKAIAAHYSLSERLT